ncbi:MAG: XTP/dITP diphosphatase [Armatimonadetes bacterium]|nr:XTP/dITP diphosphatase [Armatimonadota bacterium]
MRLITATHNTGKLRELRQLLAALPVEVVSAHEAGLPEVEETGTTFVENARLKAHAALRHTGCASLGEDSGIEVDALDGEPGVYSSRFAGPDATDEDRNIVLMQRLSGVPDEARACRYRSVVVLALPDGREFVREGTCEGRIAREPRGQNGFGYDPIFYLPDRGRTMAELSPEEKNRISHRGKALNGLKELISSLVGPGEGAPRAEEDEPYRNS